MQTLKSDIRKRILAVSKRLFLKNGYRGATTRDIAREAGITLSNLYHYYASKDARQTIVKLTAKGRGLQEKLMNVPEAVGSAVLAAAGLAGVASLGAALRRMVPSSRAAKALAAVWVGAYAFVGTQLGWMLRPFVGSPFYPVVFLREDALDRNFYEFVFGEVLPFLLGFE